MILEKTNEEVRVDIPIDSDFGYTIKHSTNC